MGWLITKGDCKQVSSRCLLKNHDLNQPNMTPTFKLIWTSAHNCTRHPLATCWSNSISTLNMIFIIYDSSGKMNVLKSTL